MQTFQHIDLNKPTVVLVDTSVALHLFNQRFAGVAHKEPRFEPLLKASMCALANCSWLPAEILATVQSVVFTLDIKANGKYWRHDYLLNPENYLQVPRRLKKVEAERLAALEQWVENGTIAEEAHKKLAIHYKAGRSLPSSRFQKIKRLAYKWLHDPAHPLNAACVGLSYYESDDWMAAIVAANRSSDYPCNIIIYTVDADLLGLVDKATTWVCMAGYEPGIRDTVEVCNRWAMHRDARGAMKLGELSTWRDVWDIKSIRGDSSDNLPPSKGVLLPVIDLIAPPPVHRLIDRADVRLAINKATNIENAISPFDASRAVKYLINNGFTPPFSNYSSCPVSSYLPQIT